MGFLESFGKGLTRKPDSRGYTVRGNTVTCPQCDCRDFDEGTAVLDRLVLPASLSGQHVRVLICDECGHVEWFLERLGP
jgi:predicted nucleic-acid-binding Zn-ribbon protein